MERVGWILLAMAGIAVVRLSPSRGARVAQFAIGGLLLVAAFVTLWHTGALARSVAWIQGHPVAAAAAIVILVGGYPLLRRR